MSTRIAIVEEDRQARNFLLKSLRGSGEFSCVQAYPNAEKALIGVLRFVPDVLVMGHRLPEMTGIECARRLKAAISDLRIILLTPVIDAATLVESLEAGLIGHLVMPVDACELTHAIQFALSGGMLFSHGISGEFSKLLRDNRARPQAPRPLTRRQYELMTHLANGLLYKEIADRLDISPATVTQHLHQIYIKLGATNKVPAINEFHRLERFLGECVVN